MKTTKKMINNKFNYLCKISGLEKTDTCATYLAIDYANIYGGYRLVMIQKSNGGHFGAFNESSIAGRMKAYEFYAYLTGLINGIEFSKNNI